MDSPFDRLPPEAALAHHVRPYFNHAVEFKAPVPREKRIAMLERVGLNVFFFPAGMVSGCDLLSDSGVTTMTNEQWAALHYGDEAYGSNKGYFLLLETIRDLFGSDFAPEAEEGELHTFLFHQGRASENALFSILGRSGKNFTIPSNGHFDTTQANIEANGISAINLFSPELKNPDSLSRFKGNMDLPRLEEFLEAHHERVPLVYLNVTNNTGGGQPVSLENIRAVSALAHRYEIPFFLDACRFAENAWFIKCHEEGYEAQDISAIIREVFALADGFTISFKKDGLVNMGGGLFLKKGGLFQRKYPDLPEAIMNHQIVTEGHSTYGGMSGRDLMTLVHGLRTIVREEYLSYRIGQVRKFGESMRDAGLPVVSPIGGHAVYLDMNRFFADTALKPGDFGGISFTALLLAGYGHRACELGNFAFGSYDAVTGKETFPENNFVRFAVPRLRYEEEDLAAVVEAAKALYAERQQIPPVDVVSGKDLALRHFKARFAFRS